MKKLTITGLAVAALTLGVAATADAGVVAPAAGMRSATVAQPEAQVQKVYWVYRHHRRFWVAPRRHR